MKTPAEARAILRKLEGQHPNADTELAYSNPFELLVATILSAQTTDVRVNEVTPALFAAFPDARALAGAEPASLEALIHATGFFRQKARALAGMARALVDRHGGAVPASMEALVALPGVGRKTANVIMNTAFGAETFAVDTHVFRVSNRTGLAPGKNVMEVERKLDKVTPPPFRRDAHHLLILHGRYVCKARKPECWRCPIAEVCRFNPKTPRPA